MQVTPFGWVLMIVQEPPDEVNTSITRPEAVTPMAAGGFFVVLAQMGQELAAFAANGALWRDLRLCGG